MLTEILGNIILIKKLYVISVKPIEFVFFFDIFIKLQFM